MIAKSRRPAPVDGPSDRAAVLDVAQADIPKIFAYDYQTVERSLADAYPLLTPNYRQEFEKSANTQVIPEAKKRQVVVQANVVGAAVESLDQRSAQLLVFMNRTVTDVSQKPVYDGSRLQVTMQHVDNKWLVDYIKPV
ncbi:MAG TPA: mammalian cell entry protein [Mycobacterium sp.]|nr:mammalian cell entry protein [Mycobacterium sp.]HTQ22359.1 mammalian cell entry protein [Mycobacterium sp.]